MLTACATVNQPQQQTAENANTSFGARVQTLSNIVNWDLKGLIAIRQAQNGGTVNILWKQQNQSYYISFFGPLGSHPHELSGRPGSVELVTDQGKRFKASSPEILLAQQLGWHLPVSDLFYWIRGLPVPGIPAEKKLDSYNHIVELRQDNWVIQYLRYTSVNHVDVPDKIFLNGPQLNIRIAISQWRF